MRKKLWPFVAPSRPMIHVSWKILRNVPLEMNLLSQHIGCFLCFSSFIITKDIPMKTESFLFPQNNHTTYIDLLWISKLPFHGITMSLSSDANVLQTKIIRLTNSTTSNGGWPHMVWFQSFQEGAATNSTPYPYNTSPPAIPNLLASVECWNSKVIKLTVSTMA